MELAEIRLFEPQMAEIDLFTMPDAVGVGEPSVRKQKSYIAGHVTDGSSSFTFKVNGTTDITVSVDEGGWWYWEVDRTLTSLYNCFASKTNLDIVEMVCPDSVTNLRRAFYQCSKISSVSIKGKLEAVTTAEQMFVDCQLLETLKIANGFAPNNLSSFLFGCYRVAAADVKNEWFVRGTDINRFNMNGRLTALDLSLADNCADFQYILQNNSYVTTLNLPNIKANVLFICGSNNNALETVTINSTKSNLSFAGAKKLTEQSVVNLFNAVAADDITLTFHADVFAMIEAQMTAEEGAIYDAYMDSDYDFNYASA